MKVRLASPKEAKRLWFIRNQAIRHGCKNSYDPQTICNWTPDEMPPSYIKMVENNPFFVAVNERDEAVSTGFLNLESNSIDAIFTLPEYMGHGAAGLILDAIKAEAKKRKISTLTLDSSPNAERFYQKHGFTPIRHDNYYSALAQANLACIHMKIAL
ncbi:GNAT family N-acetyltransferase [Providencia sp.]|uniref:GNAT family N-acetyltransferase n=1 Tax=Providencia sp. TaxID=589 RepID=UPI00333EC43A